MPKPDTQPDKPLEGDYPEAPPAARQPIEDDPALVEELHRLEQPPAAPLADEPAPAKPAAPAKDDLRETLAQIAEGQRQLQEAVRQMAEINESAMRQRPPQPEPAREPPRPTSTWRERVAPGTDKILDDAFSEMFEQKYGERLERDLKPSLGYLWHTQENLLDHYLTQKYPHPEFGYNALRKDIDAYVMAQRRAGVAIDKEKAFREVAFDAMQGSLTEAEKELQKRTRESKRREFVDAPAGVGRDQEGPAELSQEEKHAAWMTWPDKPRDEAERLFTQHREGAQRDGLIEAEERRERREQRPVRKPA